MPELSDREQAVLELLRESIGKGIIPSVREIGRQLGIPSTSTVHHCLNRLQEE